jgi:hypothetical protein
MPPPFVLPILRWNTTRKGKRVPNIADSDNNTSIAISSEMFRMAGVESDAPLPRKEGTMLEQGVELFVENAIHAADPHRSWLVGRKLPVTGFVQYAHLARLMELVNADKSGTLGVQIGRDYVIKPDVTVGIRTPRYDMPFLHAAVSCKWTMRSDRVQNVRHEGTILTRHRRGRQPHLMTVTLEPLPSRIASLGRGTGEVDKIYHPMLVELCAATDARGTAEQRAVLDELCGQDRLVNFDLLIDDLTL